MKILVTGGSGFVGSRLVDRLRALGHDVTNLDSATPARLPELTIVGDLRSYESCETAVRGQDVIMHLAALYRDDVRPRSLYYEVNVEGTRNIVRAAEAHGIRHIIFTSSFSVYGLDDAGKSEDGALSPVNDYGRTKLEGEGILRQWQAGGAGRTLQMVRPCVIFGEGGRGNVWTLVRQIASGKFLMIGSGANRKSMAYVGNIVEFLAFLLGRADRTVQVYNYADKPDMPVREIVAIAGQTLGRRVLSLPLPRVLALLAGFAGDALGRLTGRGAVLTSERVRKFMADTSLPVERVEGTGFVRPFELRRSYVETIRFEFPEGRVQTGKR
jgi:GlcNAc-P-P-Und epimerase